MKTLIKGSSRDQQRPGELQGATETVAWWNLARRVMGERWGVVVVYKPSDLTQL